MNGTENDRVFGLENIQAPLEHFPLAVPFESDSVDVLLISFADHIYRVLLFRRYCCRHAAATAVSRRCEIKCIHTWSRGKNHPNKWRERSDY